jgi:hypothetical protein
MNLRMTAFVVVSLIGVGVAVLFASAAHRTNEQRLQSLEREMKASAARNAVPVTRPAPWTPPESSPPTITSSPDRPTEARAAEVGSNPGPDAPPEIGGEEEYYFKVDAAFSEETADPAWAKETERNLNKALLEVAETSIVDTIECRQSLCKASLRHTDQDKFSAFTDRLVAHANGMWTGEISWHRDSVSDAGAVQSTLYFGKPGVSINELALAQ